LIEKRLELENWKFWKKRRNDSYELWKDGIPDFAGEFPGCEDLGFNWGIKMIPHNKSIPLAALTHIRINVCSGKS
jgi:hypothetical protein